MLHGRPHWGACGEKMFKTEDYGKFLQKNIHDEEIIGIFQATETMSMTPQIYFIGVTDKNFYFVDSNKSISKIPWEQIFEIKVKGGKHNEKINHIAVSSRARLCRQRAGASAHAARV